MTGRLVGDPGLTGMAGNVCGRLSALWMVYSQLLNDLAAVEICIKYTVCLTEIVYFHAGSEMHNFASVLTKPVFSWL